MENASKALIMAGAVLISLILISLTMYLVTTIRSYAEASAAQSYRTQAEAFNRYFVYSKPEGNATIKGDEVYNLIGKAIDINSDVDALGFITIKFQGGDITDISPETLKSTYFNKSFIDSSYSYNYKLGNRGLVSEISFVK